MGTSIQFRGIDTVLKAFENYDAEAWAVFQAKNLLFKGVGGDMLEQVLTSMKPFGSDAVYQLKVYDDIADAKEIKEKTQADGSFAFKLGAEEQSVGSIGYQLHTKMLEDRIKKLEEGDDDDDEDKSIGGRIGNAIIGLLEQPNELISLIGAIRQLAAPQPANVATIGRIQPDFAPPMFSQPPAPFQHVNNSSMENKNEQPAQAKQLTDEEKMLRMAAAIDTLEKADPQIMEHLEALAKISSDNPQMFKMLLLNLDTFGK